MSTLETWIAHKFSSGRAAVVASWLEDGDVAVARGVSEYRDSSGGPIVRVYENCFVMRFDSVGRCREFTEFYVKRSEP